MFGITVGIFIKLWWIIVILTNHSDIKHILSMTVDRHDSDIFTVDSRFYEGTS